MKRNVTPDMKQKVSAEAQRERREGERRVDGNYAQVWKVSGCMRKANKGNIIAND